MDVWDGEIAKRRKLLEIHKGTDNVDNEIITGENRLAFCRAKKEEKRSAVTGVQSANSLC